MSDKRISVRLGEMSVGRPGEVLVTLGLGSCVAVILYDPAAHLGGLAHVMLPDPANGRSQKQIGRFGSTAVAALLEMLEEAGASRSRIYARLVGGAAMFEGVLTGPARALGERNLAAVRKALEAEGIRVEGESSGGTHGRSVHFHVADGRVLVSSVRHGKTVL